MTDHGERIWTAPKKAPADPIQWQPPVALAVSARWRRRFLSEGALPLFETKKPEILEAAPAAAERSRSNIEAHVPAGDVIDISKESADLVPAWDGAEGGKSRESLEDGDDGERTVLNGPVPVSTDRERSRADEPQGDAVQGIQVLHRWNADGFLFVRSEDVVSCHARTETRLSSVGREAPSFEVFTDAGVPDGLETMGALEWLVDWLGLGDQDEVVGGAWTAEIFVGLAINRHGSIVRGLQRAADLIVVDAVEEHSFDPAVFDTLARMLGDAIMGGRIRDMAYDRLFVLAGKTARALRQAHDQELPVERRVRRIVDADASFGGDKGDKEWFGLGLGDLRGLVDDVIAEEVGPMPSNRPPFGSDGLFRRFLSLVEAAGQAGMAKDRASGVAAMGASSAMGVILETGKPSKAKLNPSMRRVREAVTRLISNDAISSAGVAVLSFSLDHLDGVGANG